MNTSVLESKKNKLGVILTPDEKQKQMAFIGWAAMSDTDECIIWPYGLFGRGYGRLRLSGVTYRVHRYVLSLASGFMPDRKIMARHGECHNRACINPNHLSWGTAKENHKDRIRDGTKPYGEKSTLCKLTDDEIFKIFELLDKGMTQTEVGKLLGITQSYVSKIKLGIRRPDLKRPKLEV